MWAGEPHSPQTCHLAARTKEVREPMMPAVAIRVDVLSQQGDLHDPFGHQLLDLGQDLLG